VIDPRLKGRRTACDEAAKREQQCGLETVPMSLPLAEEINFNALIELAQRRFDANLLKIEAQVIEHSVRAAEFALPSAPLDKPTIRAEFLR
jgi:hypothetical protein